MNRRIAALALALAAAPAARAQDPTDSARPRVQVTVDASLARHTLDLLCSQREVDLARLRESPAVQQMLRHMGRFDPRITLASYLAAQGDSSQCRAPAPDLFDFATVKERATEARATLDRIAADPAAFERTIVDLLVPFLPANFELTARVHLIAGSNSCGMSSGGVLLVDLRCTGDDLAGLQYLIAHEVFHGAQERFFHPVEEQAADAARALEYLFGNLLTEGSAVYLADYSRLPTGGRYVNQSQRTQRRNVARREYNQRLFAFVLEHVMNARPFSRERAETAYLVGYSGAYDSPFYYVGYDLMQAVDEAYGRSALICLFSLPPEQMVLAVDELARSENGRTRSVPALEPAVIVAARHVASALGRARDMHRRCTTTPARP